MNILTPEEIQDAINSVGWYCNDTEYFGYAKGFDAIAKAQLAKVRDRPVCPECNGSGGSGGETGFAGWTCSTCKGTGKVDRPDREEMKAMMLTAFNFSYYEVKGKRHYHPVWEKVADEVLDKLSALFGDIDKIRESFNRGYAKGKRKEPFTLPEREKELVRILSPGLLRRGDALDGIGELVEDDGYLFLTLAHKDKIAAQISALFDEEGIRKQLHLADKNYIDLKNTFDERVEQTKERGLEAGKLLGAKEERERIIKVLEDALENDFVMAIADPEGETMESTIDPISIREILQALKEGK